MWLRAPPANQSHISLTKAKLCSLRKFRRFSELCVRNWMKTKHPCFSSRVSTGGCGQDGLIKPEIPSPQGSTKKQNASKKSQEQERNDDSGLSAPGHGIPPRVGARSGSRLAPGHVRTEREHSRPEAPGSGGRADRSHPQARRLRGAGSPGVLGSEVGTVRDPWGSLRPAPGCTRRFPPGGALAGVTERHTLCSWPWARAARLTV